MRALYSKKTSKAAALFVICTFLLSIFSVNIPEVHAEAVLTVPNPGFEDVSNGQPANWTLQTGVDCAMELNTNPQYVRSGSNSIKITDTSTAASISVLSAPIEVQPGNIYEASVYCYKISGSPELYLEFYNSSNVRIGVVVASAGAANTWSKITSMGMAPEGTTYAKLRLYCGTAPLCEAYYDDAAIKMMQSEMQNTSFEVSENGLPAAWVCSPATSVSTSSEKVFDGAASLKVTDQSTSEGVLVRSSPVPVTPGALYEASVYSYNESGESQMYIEFYDSKGTRIDVGIYSNTTNGQWKKISGRREAPSAALYATVLLYSHMSNVGTAYYDKVSFEKLDKTLVNGNFENVAGGKPTYWNYSQPDSSEASTATVYEGSYSLKLTDSSDSASLYALSGKIPVEEGNEFEASVYTYSEGCGSELSLGYYDVDDNLLLETKATNDTYSQWKLLTAKGTAPYNTSYLKIRLSSSAAGTGSVFFDNGGLRMISDTPVRDFPLKEAGHPRLYFTSADIPALREKASDTNPSTTGGTGKDLWTSVENTAQGYLQETSFTISYYNGYQVTYPLPPQQPGPMDPPPGYTAGAYPYWTMMARAIQQRIETLSLAYSVTRNTAYADRAKAYTLSVCGWDVWSDANSLSGGTQTNLDTAHLTMGVSAAYDMLYDLLTESERTTIENALVSKGLEPLFADTKAKIDHNIQMLRACALGTGSAVLLGKEPNASKYLTRATDYYKWYLDMRMNSGQQEGLMYTSYATENLMRAIDLIARTTGERDLVEHPFINDFIVKWALYSLIPGGSGLSNFSDASISSYFYVTMNVAAQWLDNGYAGWYLANAKPSAESFERFIYFKPDLKVTPPDSLETSAVFDQIGWASLRTGWDRDDTMLEFISNNSKLGHNHYDQNSFIIGTNNSVIASDPGYEDYSPGPNRDFTLQYGHNTIYVDGKSQNVLGNGTLTKGLLSPIYDYVIGSAAKAYINPSLTKFDRHIVNIKPGYYVMLDDLKSDAARSYDWQLYTGSPADFEIDGTPAVPGQSMSGNNVYIHKGAAQMAVRFLAPGTLPISVGTYPGAEGYGPFVKVGSGTPSTEYRFLSVIKTAAHNQSGEIKALDLGDPVESSGQEYKPVNVGSSVIFFYKALDVGNYFTLKFNVDKTGDYDIGIMFIKSPLYGKVQVYVDGQPMGGIYDGYNKDVTNAPQFDLGRIHLTEGSHQIKFQAVGKNDSSGGYYIGVDSIKLIPADASGTPQAEKVSVDATLLQADNVIGAAVSNGDLNDYVLFKTGSSDIYTVSNIESNAVQSYVSVNTSGKAENFAMTRGTTLKYGGSALLSGSSVFSAALGINGNALEGVIDAASGITAGIYTGSQASVLLDGQPLTGAVYDAQTGVISFPVPAGLHKVSINDTEPPVITVNANGSSLVEGMEFPELQPVQFNISAYDAFSGVASVNTLLDGKTLDTANPVSFVGLPGEHRLSVTAADAAGNTVSREYSFIVATSTDSLSRLLEQYEASGDLKGPLVPQLENSLSQAVHQLEKGSYDQASKHMEDFVKHLNNPALSENVTEAAKAVLNADANWLIDCWNK